VPAAGELRQYVCLCAGWNVLVEIGLALGINLDKPERARKVGNELIV
jgi:glucosamine--fructose-6-phosphate aminotransferase (isomerizing)